MIIRFIVLTSRNNAWFALLHWTSDEINSYTRTDFFNESDSDHESNSTLTLNVKNEIMDQTSNRFFEKPYPFINE